MTRLQEQERDQERHRDTISLTILSLDSTQRHQEQERQTLQERTNELALQKQPLDQLALEQQKRQRVLNVEDSIIVTAQGSHSSAIKDQHLSVRPSPSPDWWSGQEQMHERGLSESPLAVQNHSEPPMPTEPRPNEHVQQSISPGSSSRKTDANAQFPEGSEGYNRKLLSGRY